MTSLLPLAVRVKSKTKLLEKFLGGKWTYDGHCSWNCDNGSHVSRCSAGVDEWDNELGPAQYYLYNIVSVKQILWRHDGLTLI